MPNSPTTSVVGKEWTSSALSLEASGLSAEQIASQLGITSARVEAWLTSDGAKQARAASLVGKYGTVKGAVEGLFRESVIPATLRLIEIATAGPPQYAMPAIERILTRSLGSSDKTGINLDLSTSAGVTSTADRLVDFFTEQPALFAMVMQRLGKSNSVTGGNTDSPEGAQPLNVIPIRNAVASRGESVPALSASSTSG